MIQEIELVASPKGQAEGVQIVKRKNVLEFYFYSRTSIFYNIPLLGTYIYIFNSTNLYHSRQQFLIFQNLVHLIQYLNHTLS